MSSLSIATSAAGAALVLSLLSSAPSQAAQALPDWRGVWQMTGGTIWDRATAEPADARSGDPGARERPPYNEEWEAKYLANIEKVKLDRLPDPITTCGTPIGYPRILNTPDGVEFVVTPKQTWVLTENGPNVLRIYTDGRSHPAGDDLWPTYTGDSVGHWEGDTLVYTTVGIRGENGAIVDRTGIVLSDKAHFTTRIRRKDANTMEMQVTTEDPVAFTRPWVIIKQYRKLPGDVRIMDYACAENNRNPVDANGKTLTLDTKGNPIDVSR